MSRDARPLNSDGSNVDGLSIRDGCRRSRYGWAGRTLNTTRLHICCLGHVQLRVGPLMWRDGPIDPGPSAGTAGAAIAAGPATYRDASHSPIRASRSGVADGGKCRRLGLRGRLRRCGGRPETVSSRRRRRASLPLPDAAPAAADPWDRARRRCGSRPARGPGGPTPRPAPATWTWPLSGDATPARRPAPRADPRRRSAPAPRERFRRATPRHGGRGGCTVPQGGAQDRLRGHGIERGDHAPHEHESVELGGRQRDDDGRVGGAR